MEPSTLLAVLCAAAALGPPSPAAEAESAALAARIDAYVRPLDAVGHLSGNLLVRVGERVVYEGSFGEANRELGVPVTPDTRFNVASVTKTMNVAALARLVESGKLAQDDPLAKWLPGFPRADRITVGMLANHTAGIPHRVTTDAEETAPLTPAEIVEFVARADFDFEPGERSQYSSMGFVVLARVMELAAGKPWPQLMDELVFRPAGMTHTAHVDSRTVLHGRSTSYFLDARGGVTIAPLKDLSFLAGAGSLWSTARDLDLLVRSVRDGKLGDAARDSLLREEGIRSNGHTNGFRAFVHWLREPDMVMVWVSNLHTGAGDALRRDLPRIVAGEEVPVPEIPRPGTSETLAALGAYEGAYQLFPGTILQVRAVDGGLTANEWTLVSLGARRFFSLQDYATVEVVTDDGGAPLRLDWRVGGETFPCPRLGDVGE